MDWQPIDTAPKDGTAILGLCNHKADPYYDDGGLTDYGARCEGMGHVEDGPHVLVWDPMRDGGDWETGPCVIPAGWLLSHDDEVMANPTHWVPIPPEPTP